MTTKEARNLIANAVATSKISREDAVVRHNRLSEIATGKVCGSRISKATKARLIDVVVADLI